MAPDVSDPGRLMAHRGASLAAPENTLAAFRTAARQGASWVEFDVSLLGDGTPVIHHDATLDRCTNRTGALSALSRADLDAITAGGDEPLPTLDAALGVIFDLGLFANLEMKCHAVPPGAMARVIADALRPLPWASQRIVVSSFEHDALAALRREMPAMPLAVLYEAAEPGWEHTVQSLSAAALHIHYTHLSESLLTVARHIGVAVRVYTINDPALLVPFRGLGLGGVITDHPPLFLDDAEWADWIAAG